MSDKDEKHYSTITGLSPEKQAGLGLVMILAGLGGGRKFRPFSLGWWFCLSLVIPVCMWLAYLQFIRDPYPDLDFSTFGVPLPCDIDVVKEIAAQNNIPVERSDQIVVLSHELGGEISAALKIYRANGALSHNPNIQFLLFGVTDSRRVAWVSAQFYPDNRGPESWADWCALTNEHWWTTNKRFYTEDAVYTTASGKKYHYNPVYFFHGENRQQLTALFNEPEEHCLTIGDEQVVVPRWEWKAE